MCIVIIIIIKLLLMQSPQKCSSAPEKVPLFNWHIWALKQKKDCVMLHCKINVNVTAVLCSCGACITETDDWWEEVLLLRTKQATLWLLYRSCIQLSCSCSPHLAQAFESAVHYRPWKQYAVANIVTYCSTYIRRCLTNMMLGFPSIINKHCLSLLLQNPARMKSCTVG